MWCQVHSSHISSFYIQQPHTDTPIFSDSTLVKLSPRLPGKYSNLISSDNCIIIELLCLPLLGDSKNHLIFSDGTLVFFFVRSDLLFFFSLFFFFFTRLVSLHHNYLFTALSVMSVLSKTIQLLKLYVCKTLL